MVGASDLSKRGIFLDDSSTSINDIKARCRRIKNKHGLDVVIIDYLQLIETSEKAYSMDQEIARISRELKKIAKKLKVSGSTIGGSTISIIPSPRTAS